MTKILFGVGFGVLLLVFAAFAFGPQLIQILVQRQEMLNQEQSNALARSSADLLTKGDITAAQQRFQEGIDKSMNLEERAKFETLLATSYVPTDLSRAAKLYVSVANNTGYAPDTRSAAQVQLLVALGSHHDEMVAGYVFSQPPFSGLYRNDTKNADLDYEIALSAGHEQILQTYPNFLSHLIVGEFYARKYPYVTPAQKKGFAPKIKSYFILGTQELEQAEKATYWDETRIALGYFNKALFTRAYANLLRTNTFPKDEEVALSDTEVVASFDAAASYVTAKVANGPFSSDIQLLIALNKAGVILSGGTSDKATLSKLGDSLAQTLASDAGVRDSINAYGSSIKLRDREFRKTLVTLAASYSPSLKEALLRNTTTFTAKDF
ncbi:hypothetical protein K2Q08_00050 [Patescibacteria group bacterium]|nr:hypothetical protein [Patescibacteria group bacterium]